jgi:hypothetical protein
MHLLEFVEEIRLQISCLSGYAKVNWIDGAGVQVEVY